jgi:hypothetical protein
MIKQQPQRGPHQPQAARDDKGRLPAVVRIDPSDERRREDRADGRTTLDDAMHKRPLLRRIPIAHHAKGRHEVAGLAQAEQKAQHAQRPHADDERVRHVRQRPPHDEHKQRHSRSPAIDEEARADIHHRVSGEKRGEDVRVFHLGDAELLRQHRCQHRQSLPVHVIDHRGEKQ